MQRPWGGRVPGVFEQLEEGLFDRRMESENESGKRYWQ